MSHCLTACCTHRWYPVKDECDTGSGEGHQSHPSAIQVLEDGGDWLKLLLVVLPVVHGIVLTFDNAFKPKSRKNALYWGAAACESESE